MISTHDLTKRSTRWLELMAKPSKNFNSRPHEEVDCPDEGTTESEGDFNSRPHEEVDMEYTRTGDGTSLISTHDLTKRSTLERRRNGNQGFISTHDLTKRSTRLFHQVSDMATYFNSRPHEEVD